MSLDKMKTRARNLQRAMHDLLKQPIKLSLAYELIAKEEGYLNWDTACAMLQPAAPRRYDLPSSITLRKTWHDPAFSLDRMIVDNQSLSTVRDAIQARQMMLIVISGPTGSGKSSLAKSMLTGSVDKIAEIDPHDSHFPVKYRAALLRAVDIIYFTEMTTLECFKAAVEAATTGYTVVTTLHGANQLPLLEMLREAIPGVENLNEHKLFHEGKGMTLLHMHLDTGTTPSKQQVSVSGMQDGPVLARSYLQPPHRHTIHSADREALLCKLSSLKAACNSLERYLHLPQDQLSEEDFDDLLAELDDADRSTRRLANSLRDDLSIADSRKIARHIKISEADILWFEREAARNRAKGNHFVADNYHRSVLLIRKRLSEKLIPMQQNLNRTTDN